MNNKTKFLINLLVFMVLVVPGISFAGSPASTDNGGLVPCTNTPVVGSDGVAKITNGRPEYTKPCDFNALMALVNKVIHFVLFDMAIPIAAIMFVYAGVLMISSGGSTESRSKAKNIFKTTIIGLVLAIAAWLIITTILGILGYGDASWIGLKI